MFTMYKRKIKKDFFAVVFPTLSYSLKYDELKDAFNFNSNSIQAFNDIYKQIKEYYDSNNELSDLYDAHDMLMRQGSIPYLNTELSYFLNPKYLKSIILNRLSALTLDKILNKNIEEIKKIHDQENNASFFYTIKKNYFMNKVYLSEIIDVARKIDLMFENSNIDTRFNFQYGFDHNNQFIDGMDYDFNIDCSKSVFYNLEHIVELDSYNEIIESLNEPLRLFVGEFGETDKIDIISCYNKIDLDKVDVISIPLIQKDPKTLIAITSDFYWVQYGMTVCKSNKRLSNTEINSWILNNNTKIQNS